MPRGSNGVYQLPSGSQAQPNTVIESAMFNATILDIQQDLNAVRPISSGGTGQSTLAAVKLAFGITALENIVGTGNINANNITSGTLAPARLSGTYNISITGNAATATTAGNSTNLGGQPATNYARTDIAEIFNQNVTIAGNSSLLAYADSDTPLNKVNFGRDGNQHVDFHGGPSANFLASKSADSDPKPFIISAFRGANKVDYRFDEETPEIRAGGFLVWHSNNDGSGSGLDADVLDGQQGSFYLNASNINAGVLNTEHVPNLAASKITSGTLAPARLSGTYNISISGNAATATSAVSADTVDGFHGSQFLRSDASDLTIGNITMNALVTTERAVAPHNSTNEFPNGIYVEDSNDFQNVLENGGANSAALTAKVNDARGFTFIVNDNGAYARKWHPIARSWMKFWTNRNDGSGSELDADLLDGLHASAFVQTGATPNFTAGFTFSGATFRGYTSVSDPDIHSFTGGTTQGVLLEGPESSHFVIGLTGNDENDALRIIQKPYSTDATRDYDTEVLRCNRSVFLYNSEQIWHDGNAVHNIVQNNYTGTQLYSASTDRHITVLNTTINKRHSGTAVLVQARISLERAENGMLYILRGNTEIGSGPNNGNRYHGMVPINHDNDNNSTMQTIVVNYLDVFSGTGNQQYQFWVRGTNDTMSINRTLGDADTTSFERASSQVILQEVFIS